jgi:hypothetical protein
MGVLRSLTPLRGWALDGASNDEGDAGRPAPFRLVRRQRSAVGDRSELHQQVQGRRTKRLVLVVDDDIGIRQLVALHPKKVNESGFFDERLFHVTLITG